MTMNWKDVEKNCNSLLQGIIEVWMPNIYMKRLIKAKKTHRQDNRQPGRDSKLGPSEYLKF